MGVYHNGASAINMKSSFSSFNTARKTKNKLDVRDRFRRLELETFGGCEKWSDFLPPSKAQEFTVFVYVSFCIAHILICSTYDVV